ncbi:hypothetical protein N7513_005143 [Penicillium frequentans]|nr:hypothetical protein N7513_005143 [Penicillium glabrum]
MPSKSSAQNTTFRCPLCPRKFTRAFNLRGHVRTHTDERPFACGVCGRAFTRQHDRRTHEQLHNREMKWVCGGLLENGKSWGCGRRYDRKSNLSRHHRSKIGQGCIKPISDGDSAEESTVVEERPEMQLPITSRPPPQPTNAEHICEKAQIKIENALELIFLFLGHIAAVHKLVMWPSVKVLLHPHEYDQDNLMKLERQRESTYARFLRDIPSSADDTVLSTSSLAHDGAGGRSKSNPNETSIAHAGALFTDSCMEIDQSGVFKLSEKTSRRYYQSYLDRMHILHPFLDEQELELKVEAFIKCYSHPYPMSTTEVNRYYTGIEVLRGPFDNISPPGQFVERNIDNAIILLIFAVGAICNSQSPTLSPIMNQMADSHLPRFSSSGRQATPGDSTQAVNDVLSPAPLHCAQQATASLCEQIHTPSKHFPFPAKIGDNGSRRMTHANRGEGGNARNKPFVPGLALYHAATATIRCLLGASSLEFVHACLLAGIYAGQFADPFQSHVWISEAARACQILVQRPSCEYMDDHTKELRNFAYWSCLQLESDLLAELDVHASGMSQSEYRVSLPRRGYPMNGPDGLISPTTIMMMYYYSLIHLQKIRNHMHTFQYDMKNQSRENHAASLLSVQNTNLDLWRHCLPIPLEWKDTDEPAKDINAAFLRGMYYRTKYILHLPMLYYVLHYGETSAWKDYVARISVDSLVGFTTTLERSPYHGRIDHMLIAMDSDTSKNSLTFPQHWAPPSFDWRKLTPRVRFACKKCVECAIQSLKAFDGIEDRLVLPNIFGTAHDLLMYILIDNIHRQFGYLLVLCATYNSSLSEFVDRSTLDQLFKRIICFLLQSENNSPTLRADIRILKEIYLKLFKRPLMPTDA